MSGILLYVTVFAGSFSQIFPVPDQWLSSPMNVCQLAGGSFAFSRTEVMEDLEVCLLNSEGELQFEKQLGVPGRALESGGWLLPASDGGFYVCAFSEPRATGANSDIALFRLSESGAEEWCAHIGRDEDIVYSGIDAAVSDNGGCAVLGANEYGYENAFLRMYSPGGDIIWEINFDDFASFIPISVSSADDGFLVLLVKDWDEMALVLRVNNEGDMQWSTEIPYSCGFGPSAALEIPEGYRIYFSDGDNTGEGVYASIGLNGDLRDTVLFNHGVRTSDVLLTDEGNIVLAGSRIIDGEEGAAIEGYDHLGELIWTRRMDGPGEDRFTSVCSCSDGGFALIGYMNSSDPGDPCGTVFVRTGIDGEFIGSANPSVIPIPVGADEAKGF